MSKRQGYNPIPDVEANQEEDGPSTRSKEAAREKYGLEGDQEIELLAMMDSACNMKPSFQFPAVQPEELVSQGKSFLWSIMAPTVSVVCTVALAWLLSATAQGEDWMAKISTFLIPLFPYINAIIVFMASFLPMQQRFLDSIEPVLAKIDGVQQDAERNVDQLADRVDTIVDRIQAKVNQCLEPYLPKLAMATKMEAMIQTIKPGIDIPDPSDVDREFDEAQGLVRTKIDQAKDQVDIHTMIPTVFQSSQAFYWRVVVPFGIVALAIQLLLVSLQPVQLSTSNVLGNITSTIQNTSVVLQSEIQSMESTASDPLSRLLVSTHDASESLDRSRIRRRALVSVAVTDINDQTANHQVEDHISRMLSKKDAARTTIDVSSTMDQAADVTANSTASLKTYQDDATNQVTETVQELEEQASDAITSAEETWQTYQSEAEEEISQAASQIKPMLTSIALSYLVALLQLGLVYLLSSDKVKTYCINLGLQIAKGQVDKALEESGVTATIDDVLVTRLERIRIKVLKIIKVANELDDVLDKIPGGGDVANKASEALGKLGGRLGLGTK